MRTNQHTFFSVRYEFSEVEFMRCELLMDFGDAMRDAMDVTRKPMYKSLRRLAVIIKLILKCFTPKLMIVQQQESRAVSSNVKKPTMLQLSTVNSKKKLSEKIQQRLLHRPPLTPSHEEDMTAAFMPSSVISYEIQNLLVTPPWNRSSELLEKAHRELQECGCDAFNDYPVPVQKSICKLCWYQLLQANRVICTAGCEPTCCYILLSGSVIEVDGNVRSSIGNIINIYNDGASFGDGAIIDGSQRTTSFYAKDQVELLVISRSDYTDLSLRQTRKSYQESKHFMFCRIVSILKYWPMDQLTTENCSQCYYKPGTVVVRDSKKCDHIFIIMSGSCNVIKRFIDSSSSSVQSKVHHQKSLTGDTTKSPLSTQFHSQNRKMDEGETAENDDQNLRKMRDRRATYPNFQEDNELDKPKGKQILIQLQTLHPKDIFGLSTILYEDEPSISLVSNGSECILIAKTFILAHMTERIKTWLYQQVQQFPSQEMMLKRIKEHQHWNIYKQTLVSHLKKKHT